MNTCDQNVARCCEVMELNARVQAQLFKLVSLTAAEGKFEPIKNPLLVSEALPDSILNSEIASYVYIMIYTL